MHHTPRIRLVMVALMCATAAVAISPPAAASLPQLQPVLSGLTNPVYVTSARDGTRRLFVLEQAGLIKVLRPGASAPSVFLDIRSRVASGGERGLLGLAFHPYFRNTGRFFVAYTRISDAALQIAEYHVSADPNIADPAEIPLLSIPHPNFSNHNGGMLEFGPDGDLYAGTGDGGSANDPSSNAQNIDVLLGKMLRIDIDHPTAGAPYSSPPGNPFLGATPGRDEIYALGLRNPWRFSFDPGTGQQYVADVGQDAWEEIDLMTAGANYGWRVFEGTHCTGNDPALCTASSPCDLNGYTCPMAEYGHLNGRCSITGGYVYRGLVGTLPAGAYVYGDFCTGEIFTLQGNISSLLLDTARSLSSFGEDEAGELYVVGLGGTIERFTDADVPCAFAVAPTMQAVPAAGAAGTTTVTAVTGCNWTATSNVPWISATPASGTGVGTVSFTISAHTGATPRSGTLTMAGRTVTIAQGAVFTDVPATNPLYNFIEALSARGITAGCGSSQFCPNAMVTREQAAVLIERALGVFSPPTPTGQTFADVGPGMFSWPYIEDFARRGITAGCAAAPPLFCPSAPVTREQIAVFVMRAVGITTPVMPYIQRFADVGTGRFGYAYIDDLARRGITAGCAAGPLRFCPDGVVTRAELAVFLVRAFNL